jgi:hypothetical protein
VSPRTGLDDVKRRKILTLPGLELRTIGHPARSQSLYQLLYPGVVFQKRTLYPSSGMKGKKLTRKKHVSSKILLSALVKPSALKMDAIPNYTASRAGR